MNIKIGIIGVIVALFTIATFTLLDFEWLRLHSWALGFVLLSQLVFFGGLLGMPLVEKSHNKVFFRAGLSTALFLYFFSTAIAVIVFAWFFPVNLNLFILIHIGIIAFFSVISILVQTFSQKLTAVDEKSHAAVNETKAKRGGF